MDAKQTTAASDHYEQSGRVIGKLRIGAVERALNGRGQRDHSWGPRDWSGVGDWIWLSGQFESGWCMNWWSVGEGEGATITGFIGYKDRTVPAVGGTVTWQGDPDGVKPSGASVVLDLADGTRKTIPMKIYAYWPLYKDGATIMEFVCTYECEGETGSVISWPTLSPCIAAGGVGISVADICRKSTAVSRSAISVVGLASDSLSASSIAC